MTRKLATIAGDLANLVRGWRAATLRRPELFGRRGPLERLRSQLADAWRKEIDDPKLADAFAQGRLCALLIERYSLATCGDARIADWVFAGTGVPLPRDLSGHDVATAQVAELLDEMLRDANAPATLLDFYELFLMSYDPKRRTRRGVFYTPRPIVCAIVRGVDRFLRDEFILPDGLADLTTWDEMTRRHPGLPVPGGIKPSEPFVRVLDPAVGTGAFLVETIDVVWHTLKAKWQSAGVAPNDAVQRWNEYVQNSLLPRMAGIELMLAPAVLAGLCIAAKLHDTGCDFSTNVRLPIFLADSLAGPDELALFKMTPVTPGETAPARRDSACDSPVTVVVGNPPFSALSGNDHRWIQELLHGRDSNGRPTASYYEVDGQPLRERKLWLHDDYVKFFRYAQWRLSQSGCGILGFVTNHGYFDNVTFRGMRQQLLRQFPRITLVDLHGNRKKRERSPDGNVDENVFGIDAGIAIGLFRQPPDDSQPGAVAFGEMWGSRDEKLSRLEECPVDQIAQSSLTPLPPSYLFLPVDNSLDNEYQHGYRLPDIMPVHTTAPVTARDAFVIAFDRDELVRRLRDLADADLSDVEIRRRYFQHTRSAKHPPGDSRGWKLSAARGRIADEPNWEDRIQTCLYRPFDRRYVFWTDWMIDWPRTQVSRHLTAGANLALIARRQMPPGEPCHYFWITDTLTLDGVIRSDNRGSESLFPLYLYDEQTDGRANHDRQPNFDPAFIATVEQSLDLRWSPDETSDHAVSFGPLDLLHYIYALFHSTEYRTRYAELLRADFPRVFVPAAVTLFRQLAQFGSRLVTIHVPTKLQHQPDAQARKSIDKTPPSAPLACASGLYRPASTQTLSCPFVGDNLLIASGYPRWDDDRVFVNPSSWFDRVSRDVWEFRVGGHQVCRKWLKDRRGRRLLPAEVSIYQHAASAVGATLQIIRAIDVAIQQHGGFPNAWRAG